MKMLPRMLVVALLGVSIARAGITSERLLAAIIRQTPASQLVAEGQQMKRAEQAAAVIPGGEALWGVGSSMEPLYSNHTSIVVAPIKFKDLREGMTVVYVNSAGRMLVHPITGELQRGWIAQGVNNEGEDEDLVTSRNLIGVVVQAYSVLRTEFRLALAKRLVAGGWLPTDQS